MAEFIEICVAQAVCSLTHAKHRLPPVDQHDLSADCFDKTLRHVSTLTAIADVIGADPLKTLCGYTEDIVHELKRGHLAYEESAKMVISDAFSLIEQMLEQLTEPEFNSASWQSVARELCECSELYLAPVRVRSTGDNSGHGVTTTSVVPGITLSVAGSLSADLRE